MSDLGFVGTTMHSSNIEEFKRCVCDPSAVLSPERWSAHTHTIVISMQAFIIERNLLVGAICLQNDGWPTHPHCDLQAFIERNLVVLTLPSTEVAEVW